MIMNVQIANVPLFPTLLKKIYGAKVETDTGGKKQESVHTVAIGCPIGFPMTESRLLPMYNARTIFTTFHVSQAPMAIWFSHLLQPRTELRIVADMIANGTARGALRASSLM
jgi:hypothetical protein